VSEGKPGRPLKVPTPEEMDRLVEEYGAERLMDGKPVTLTGILRHLGLYSRATLGEYEKRDGFSEPVKRIRSLVETAYEERLHGANATGAIFALKNMGWSDKQEHELSGKDGGPIFLWGGKSE
jgi:hypothetical protein